MSKAQQLRSEKSLIWQFSKYCSKSCESCLAMGYRDYKSENLNILKFIEKIKFLGITNIVIPCNSSEIVNLMAVIRELKRNKIKSTLILKDCFDFSDINFDLINELDYLVLSYSKIPISNQLTILNLDQMFEPIFLFEDQLMGDLWSNLRLLPPPILQNRTLIQMTNFNRANESWSLLQYKEIVKICGGSIAVLWPNSNDLKGLLESNIKLISKAFKKSPKLSVIFFSGETFREFKDYIHHLSCQHVDKKNVELIILDKNGLFISQKKSIEFILEEAGFNYKFIYFNQFKKELSNQENLAVFDLMLSLATGQFLYPIEFNKFFSLKEFNRILQDLDGPIQALIVKKGALTKEFELIFSSELIRDNRNILNTNFWASNVNERMSIIFDAINEETTKFFILTTRINSTVKTLNKEGLCLRYLLFAKDSDLESYIRKSYIVKIFFELLTFIFIFLAALGEVLSMMMRKVLSKFKPESKANLRVKSGNYLM